MNLADAIRQAAQKLPPSEPETPIQVESKPTNEQAIQVLTEVEDVVYEEPAIPPTPPSPMVLGGNVVRLEMFLSPEQLHGLFKAAVTSQHSMMTLRETASYLRIPPATLEEMASQGRIPALTIDGKWRFVRSSVDEWVSAQQHTPREANDAA